MDMELVSEGGASPWLAALFISGYKSLTPILIVHLV